MHLSLTERLILANQYRILELIDEGNTKFYKKAQKIVREGWELDYGDLTLAVDQDPFPREKCDEVRRILFMFQALGDSFTALDDTSGLKESAVRFQGFDGNNEPHHLGYLRFLLEYEGDWTSTLVPADPDSHHLTLNRYHDKLARFNEVMDTREDAAGLLTREELLRIVGKA